MGLSSTSQALDQVPEDDVLVVWKLDRLSRSLKDMLHILEKLTEAGTGFRSTTENVDSTVPAEEGRIYQHRRTCGVRTLTQASGINPQGDIVVGKEQ